MERFSTQTHAIHPQLINQNTHAVKPVELVSQDKLGKTEIYKSKLVSKGQFCKMKDTVLFKANDLNNSRICLTCPVQPTIIAFYIDFTEHS